MINQLFSQLPPITKNIILINVIMFGATLYFDYFTNYDFTWNMGLHFYLSDDFKPYQLITHMFMHGSLMHIFFNMFAIFMFGPALEHRLGPQKYFTFYLLTGFGAVFLHFASLYWEQYDLIMAVKNIRKTYDVEALVSLWNQYGSNVGNPTLRNQIFVELQEVVQHPNHLMASDITRISSYFIDGSLSIVVGASGALFGILAGFAMLYPNQRLLFMFIPYPIKAKYFVLVYALIELYLGFSSDVNDNIAHFAHLGGAIFGALVIMIWKKQGSI